MYSAKVSFILGAMVLTGAARSVTAKLFYQLGFNHPLFLTLLYLTGQALSLIPYNIANLLKKRGYYLIWDDAMLPKMLKLKLNIVGEEESVSTPDPSHQTETDVISDADDQMEKGESESAASLDLDSNNDKAKAEEQDAERHGRKKTSVRFASENVNVSASTHGLPDNSRTRNCHEFLPWYLKPALPAFFNLLNSAMRWASLVFVAASVAEMLISGMELVLSVCATRLVRGRKITWIRWVGVLVVTVGVILVAVFDSSSSNIDVADDETNDGSTVNKQIIGIMLILGQSVMSVIQDLTEEVFMQEAFFPPVLLVGMEGAYGIVIAVILYFPLAPMLGENPSDVASSLSKDNVIVLAIGWTLLVTLTGIFNIAATAITSSMTRNVWKNLRTCLVWIIGLILFYATGSSELGEGWCIPGSFFILLSYGVMCIGIFIYYGKGSRAT